VLYLASCCRLMSRTESSLPSYSSSNDNSIERVGAGTVTWSGLGVGRVRWDRVSVWQLSSSFGRPLS